MLLRRCSVSPSVSLALGCNRASKRPLRAFHTVFLAGCLGFVVAASVASAAAGEPLEELSIFEGDWRLIDQDAGQINRERAIETAVGELNWLVRQMAAPQLVKSISPPKRMRFFRKGNQFRQRVVEADGTQERPVDLRVGKPVQAIGNGEPFEAAWSLNESGLRLSWKQHQAHGSNVYRVDPETGLMIVEHTIQVTAIDDVAPIVFESRFDRRRPPAVAAQAESGSR